MTHSQDRAASQVNSRQHLKLFCIFIVSEQREHDLKIILMKCSLHSSTSSQATNDLI